MNSNNKTIDFVFVIHNHQPVGNFDFVLEKTFADSYEPFLTALEKQPRIRIGLHYSGFLFEYLQSHHPDFLQRLRILVQRDQVEILGGAYYEAILSVLPDRDADAHLQNYTKILEDFFNYSISGMWLAERIWEPGVPSILRRNGLYYTFLDEAHFTSAGLTKKDIWGLFRTEDRGNQTVIFPIDKTLRYYIPFQPPEMTFQELERRRNDGVYLITYGDDGEKFGGWPGTKKWVYQDGWLDCFLSLLETSESVNMLLPTEAYSIYAPKADIYLPCASYEEMGEWTLPSEAQVELYKIKEELKRLDLSERIQPRLRGGYWRQFLAKYPEAARIYRRMLRVSDKVAALERKKHPEAPKARKALLKGQANDALWHGVFGGIYLPHLRYAVGKELISAENICHHALKNPSHYEKDDSDMVIENGFLRCQISAELGGAISTLDVRAKGINLVDTIARRLEPYHIRMLEASTVNQDNHASIHERLELKEPDLAQKLAQDNHQRFCFIDRFLKSNFALEDLRYNREVEVGDFLNNDYFLLNDSKDSLKFKRTGTVKQKSLTLFKTFIFSQNSMEFKVKYGFKCDIKGLEDIWFAPELNINLMAPDAPDRFFLLNGEKFPGNNLGSTGDYSGILTLSLVDEYLKIRVDITAQSKPRWLWYPVESISLSEAGIERIYQGSAIHPLWKLQDICRTETEIKMNIKIW